MKICTDGQLLRHPSCATPLAVAHQPSEHARVARFVAVCVGVLPLLVGLAIVTTGIWVSHVHGKDVLFHYASGWSETDLHRMQCHVMMVFAVMTFLIVTNVMAAPYGKHGSANGFGPAFNGRVCFCLMELPSVFMVPVCLWLGPTECLHKLPSNAVLLFLFSMHYFNRAVIFPWRSRGASKMPFAVFASGTMFVAWNAYIQVRHLTHLSCADGGLAGDERLRSPRFYVGVAVFVAGFVANIHSDAILRDLRRPGEVGYKIPRGGLFEYISGANFISEIVEWTGFALAADSYSATCFAALVVANIGPRAGSTHKWYLDKFKGEYPSNRRAFIPFLW